MLEYTHIKKERNINGNDKSFFHILRNRIRCFKPRTFFIRTATQGFFLSWIFKSMSAATASADNETWIFKEKWQWLGSRKH